MAFRQSRQILMGVATINARDANGAAHATADFLVPSAGLAAGDIIEMVGLPEGHVPLAATLVCEDLDTGTTLTIDCGILSGPYAQLLNADGSARTMGNEFFGASAIGQTGGIQAANKAAGLLITPTLDIVSIGLKIVAAPAGNIVGARLRLNVTSHAMPPGV